jgi:hypothetical protein
VTDARAAGHLAEPPVEVVACVRTAVQVAEHRELPRSARGGRRRP